MILGSTVVERMSGSQTVLIAVVVPALGRSLCSKPQFPRYEDNGMYSIGCWKREWSYIGSVLNVLPGMYLIL